MSQVIFEILKKATIKNLTEFQTQALEMAKHFTSRSVVALKGPLGAGKTEFVKTVARERGFSDVASPTFAIHHRYQGFSIGIDHLDLYRLESEEELETTGFWDFFSENEGLILIEWPERMDLSHIPQEWDLFQLEIILNENSDREMILSKRS
jgi:tRNA threonylcarbamoyladenosine biosynthesis protein TsaE